MDEESDQSGRIGGEGWLVALLLSMICVVGVVAVVTQVDRAIQACVR